MIYIFYCFLLFLSVCFKNDADTLASSEFWDTVTYHPIVIFFKNNSYYILLLSFLLGFNLIIKNYIKDFKIISHSNAFLLIFVYCLVLIRVSIQDQGFFLKSSFSLFLIISLFLIFSSGVYFYGIQQIKKYFLKSLILFSFFYIFINTINFFYGYGYAALGNRYFGIAVHPNFAGVQFAICNSILIAVIMFWRKIFLIPIFLMGVYLQIMTGSRTSFLIFFSFLLCVYFFKKKNISDYLLMIVFLISSFFIIPRLSFESMDRGGSSNTRSQVWQNMLDISFEKPFLGWGMETSNSENSFLRFAIIMGYPFLFLFIFLVLLVIKKYYSNLKNSYFEKNEYNINIVLFGLFVGLVIGGMTEGYIADTWSFPKVVLVFLIFLALHDYRGNKNV